MSRTLFTSLQEETRWFDRAAATRYDEERDWDGHNHISRATGSQWDHETLYRTAKGRWVVKHASQWEGSLDSYAEITEEAAHRWLLVNDHELPPAVEAALEG